jgi:4-diphosphocytidyl-2-C-methyl-D-erythritol kinase
MSISLWLAFDSFTRGTVRPVRYRAYAKVNLSLEVLRKRSDGFHDLVSVMQAVSLFDEIDCDDDIELQFASSDPALVGDDNLVMRAARLMRELAPGRPGASLELHKSIPYAAGLGGGSSDAAATLKSLNDRWLLDLSLETLVDIGATLGSDVPFFLYGGTALVSGRGEFVTPLPDPEPAWYALVKPPLSVATGDIFGALSPNDWTDGTCTHAVATEICDRRRVRLGMNGLQKSVFHRYPDAYTCFEDLDRATPGRAFMSGSGPTVAALCESESEAQHVVATVKRPERWTAVARSMPGTVA